MKKQRNSFSLTLHGIVSLLLPIPCFLITFLLNAFLALLVPGSMEASGGGSFVSALPMLVPPLFILSGIWRSIRRMRRRKRSRRAIASLAMCGLALIEFIILMVFMLRY